VDESPPAPAADEPTDPIETAGHAAVTPGSGAAPAPGAGGATPPQAP
jgi:hypothetical protein